MIRKILFYVGLAFCLAWLSGAYFIKSKLVSLIKNSQSDNIKLLYDDITVSGFPNIWQIHLLAPKIILISSSTAYEISTGQLLALFDFSLKDAKIVLLTDLEYQYNLATQTSKYSVSCNKASPLSVHFSKPLYQAAKTDDFGIMIKSIQLDNQGLLVKNYHQEIFNVGDLSLALAKNDQNQDILITLQAVYQPLSLPKNKSGATLYLNGIFGGDSLQPPKILTVNQLNIDLEDLKISLKGAMQIFPDITPQGKFVVELNYQDAVADQLAAVNGAPQVVTEQVMTKIATSNSAAISRVNNHRQIKFNLKFGSQGVKIDSANLPNL